MKYAQIKKRDIANGEGVRVSLFVSGCRHRCPGCFNPEAWDFDFGHEYTQATQDQIFQLLEPDFINGLTILGGEPLEPQNQEAILELIKAVKRRFPQKDIWCYTGFTLEDLLSGPCRAGSSFTAEILENIDVLVDGRFILDEKNISLRFRGSGNQRIIDMRHFRETGEVASPELF